MNSPQRLPASLTPLDVALAALLRGVAPVSPVELPLAEAVLRRMAAESSRHQRASAARHGRRRWPCAAARARSRRGVLLFALATGGDAGLGRSRRGHARWLRLRWWILIASMSWAQWRKSLRKLFRGRGFAVPGAISPREAWSSKPDGGCSPV